jgi:lipid A ethanolaminephosphotransferase
MRGRALPAQAVVAVAALWMSIAANLPLWRRLLALDMLAGVQGALFAAAMLVILWAGLTLLLGAFAWRLSLKPTITLLLLVGAFASHFMSSYGVVVDPGMVTNVLQTDLNEAGALFSGQLAVALFWMALLPAAWLWRQAVSYGSARRQLGRNLLLALSAAALLCAAVLLAFQPLASLMRNHKDIRYLLNPLSSVYAVARVAVAPLKQDTSALVPVGEDAQLMPSPRPRILLLVLGETARSANFSINGYGRPTTPQLAQEDIASFRNAWSCGTSTAASVPCMFSNLGRSHFDGSARQREGLMDVLQRAGLAVLWIDNQAGCKGVCERIPHVRTADGRASPHCADDECFDEAMLDGLDERIAALDPQRTRRGVVLVMHQMGSHGPAYHLRSPADRKRFLPECESPALQDCSRQSVVNAYDNSIAYTDHFLAQAIGWLKRHDGAADTALVYVSDHGESLGENNLYLHGMPYPLAPDDQKRVPWLSWASAGFQRSTGLSMSCLRDRRDVMLSHDNYFHAVLGLAEVTTAAYQPSLDPYATCRHSMLAAAGVVE